MASSVGARCPGEVPAASKPRHPSRGPRRDSCVQLVDPRAGAGYSHRGPITGGWSADEAKIGLGIARRLLGGAVGRLPGGGLAARPHRLPGKTQQRGENGRKRRIIGVIPLHPSRIPGALVGDREHASARHRAAARGVPPPYRAQVPSAHRPLTDLRMAASFPTLVRLGWPFGLAGPTELRPRAPTARIDSVPTVSAAPRVSRAASERARMFRRLPSAAPSSGRSITSSRPPSQSPYGVNHRSHLRSAQARRRGLLSRTLDYWVGKGAQRRPLGHIPERQEGLRQPVLSLLARLLDASRGLTRRSMVAGRPSPLAQRTVVPDLR